MLKKLVKYDFKWINRTLIFYYLIVIILCLLTRLASCFDNIFAGRIIFQILRGCAIASFFSTIITCVIRCWVRFTETTYKDESYLVHTLPVEKATMYNSKIVASLCVIGVSFIAIVIGFIIGILNNSILDYLKNIWNDSNSLTLLLRLILIVLLEVIMAYYCGIMGILLGYQKNDQRTVKSILFGILFYFLVEILVVVLLGIFGIFSQDVGAIFKSNYTGGIENMNLITTIIGCLYLVLITVFHIMGKKLYVKGVNVE